MNPFSRFLRIPFAIAIGVVAASDGAVRADEGLWTFDKFPSAKVKAAYGFAPDAAWLDRLRLGSVRLDNGCSGGLVSPRGLALTAYHCVQDCIVSLSAPGFDPLLDPMLAATPLEERTCPGLNADIVTAISDVTAAVAKASEGLPGTDAADARDAEISQIESGCRDESAGKHCEVVTLYGGGVYALYEYRRFSDVRLTFAPEGAAALFGGDPDNFNFPRHAFDVAFLRLYEDGAPAVTPSRLKWRSAPLADGELVFVSGNPAETGRLWPVSMISYVRDAYLPWSLVTGAELRGRLLAFAALGTEEARISHELLYATENAYKDEWGELMFLSTPGTIEKLASAEAELRSRARAEGLLSSEQGDPWEDIAAAYDAYRTFFFAYRYLEEAPWSSKLFAYAREIVRAVEERSKPEADRLEGYSDADLPLTEDYLFEDAPVEPAIEEIVLSFWLSKAREFLTADDPLVKKLLGQESPEALAKRLVAGTRVGDAAERRLLYEGGEDAVASSADPMIRFAKSFDAEARALADRYRNEVRELRLAALARLASVRFRVFGDSLYPDATGTLRLSYGKVAGWTEPSGRKIAPFTDFAGLFDRATGAAPYRIGPLWEAARSKLSPETLFNVSTSNDVIGGQSGAPLVDRNGEVVGVVFDGNIHSLGGFYLYDPVRNRAVSLTTPAIEEALAKVYSLPDLVDELSQ
ncbi:MAG: S46 family peptidase [Propylenella sp.]